MTDVVLAWENLFTSVDASFVSLGIQAANMFGWLEPAKQGEGDRILWVPGDPSGKIGETTGARFPGQRPQFRPIATLHELFTIYIIAADPSDFESEIKQYHAARVLRDQWYAAAYRIAHGTFKIRDEQWKRDQPDRKYGATIQLIVALEAMTPDRAREFVLVDGVTPDVTLAVNDEVESVETVTRLVEDGDDLVTQGGEPVTFTNP